MGYNRAWNRSTHEERRAKLTPADRSLVRELAVVLKVGPIWRSEVLNLLDPKIR